MFIFAKLFPSNARVQWVSCVVYETNICVGSVLVAYEHTSAFWEVYSLPRKGMSSYLSRLK